MIEFEGEKMRHHKGEDLEIGKVYYITCHSPGSRPTYPKLKSGKYTLLMSCGLTNTFKVEGKSDTFILQEHSFIINSKEI